MMYPKVMGRESTGSVIAPPLRLFFTSTVGGFLDPPVHRAKSSTGGGYGLSAFDGHVIFLAQCAERLASKGHKTVVAFLEYGECNQYE